MFLFLHPLFISSSSLLLSVYFSSLSYFREDFLSLAGRSSVCQTAALSAFSSHQPDCSATGGYITAVSGQQQVPGAACQPICAPTSPTGCCWPSACTLPTHTHTHTHTRASTLANTHPALSALPPVQERKLSHCLHVHSTTFISTWTTLMFSAKKKKSHAYRIFKWSLAVGRCLVQQELEKEFNFCLEKQLSFFFFCQYFLSFSLH